MLTNEWPLLVFTLLAQAGVGCFLVSRIFLFRTGRIQYGEYRSLLQSGLLLSFFLISSAAFFSFFHLGRPERAWLAVSHLLTSWLSREIFLVLWVLSVITILLFFRFKKNQKTTFCIVLEIAASAGAILLIWTMARLYMLPTIPAWNTAATPLSFYLSALILGGMVFFLLVNRRSSFHRTMVFNLAGFTFVLLVLQTGLFSLLGPGWGLFSQDGQAAAAAGINIAAALRISSSMAGAFLLLWIHRRIKRGQPRDLLFRTSLLAFLLILLGEITGRWLFYSVFNRVGL